MNNHPTEITKIELAIAKNKPVTNIIDALEKLLGDAKKGTITAFAYATVHPGCAVGHGRLFDPKMAQHNDLTAAVCDLLYTLQRERDDVSEPDKGM